MLELESDPYTPPNSQISREDNAYSPVFVYLAVAAFWLIPYLRLFAEGKYQVFVRNWLRCVSGPFTVVLPNFTGRHNEIVDFLLADIALVTALITGCMFLGLGRLDRRLQVVVAVLWVGFGFIATLSI